MAILDPISHFFCYEQPKCLIWSEDAIRWLHFEMVGTDTCSFGRPASFYGSCGRELVRVCARLVLLVVEKEALWGLGRWGVTDLKARGTNCAGLVCLAVSCTSGDVCGLMHVWIGESHLEEYPFLSCKYPPVETPLQCLATCSGH